MLVFWFLSLVVAQVYVGFPFNEQLPTVARVDEPYTFTMANITYRSSSGDVAYEATNLPQWLQFEAGSRTFSGTPTAQDVGEFRIGLKGSDSEGSITNEYSMIVSNATGVRLAAANVMFVELAQYGRTNGNDGLVVKEGDQIDLSFGTETFVKGARDIVAYYGRSADRSSLPNWIQFDADRRSFRGTVPHVISANAPSFEYGFSFIAADYRGYAGAEGFFKIVVGGHQLSTNVNETIKVNGTLGSDFSLDVPVLTNVYLDGAVIAKDNISSVSAQNLPSYVQFDAQSYQLSGKFPNEATFDNFTVVVKDVFGNAVDLPYSFDAIGSVFTVKDLPKVNATRGEFFQYQLMSSFFTELNATKVEADTSDWVTFHAQNLTFNGEVPDDFDDMTVKVSASSSFGNESKNLVISGVDEDEHSSSSSSSSSSSASSSSSSSSASASASSSSEPLAATSKKSGVDKKKLAIGLGVGIPAFILLLALLLLLFCCCRRRKNDDDEEESKSPGDTTLDTDNGAIDGPGFGTKVPNGSPKQMASLNVLKLDDKSGHDAASTSSSVTHVESTDESHYYDASDSEVPMKSWRANDTTDKAKYNTTGMTKSGNVRASDASLSTVNTEQLFSVRLVDDNSYLRNSNPSFASNQFLSNNSLNGMLRSDSGNFQRLDSDGNIVDHLRSPSVSPKKISRSPSSNLAPVVEHSFESTKDTTGDYHSAYIPESGTEGSMNLLARLGVDEPHLNSTTSLYDDLKSAEKSQNDLDWVEGSGRPRNPSRVSNATLGDEAKLVDFTRRSSLRESSRQVENSNIEGQTALIHEDDSE